MIIKERRDQIPALEVTEREMSTQKQWYNFIQICLCVLTLFCQFLMSQKLEKTGKKTSKQNLSCSSFEL